MAIDNPWHYEDVLVVRVRNLVPHATWTDYELMLINGFEKLLESGTRILKFYLHISPCEQLARFKERLDDLARHWKISEVKAITPNVALWPHYIEPMSMRWRA